MIIQEIFKINNELPCPKTGPLPTYWLILLGQEYSSKQKGGEKIKFPPTNPLGFLDFAGIRKLFGTVMEIYTIFASDIFNTIWALRQEVKSDGFRAIYENYFEHQIARVGFK